MCFLPCQLIEVHGERARRCSPESAPVSAWPSQLAFLISPTINIITGAIALTVYNEYDARFSALAPANQLATVVVVNAAAAPMYAVSPAGVSQRGVQYAQVQQWGVSQPQPQQWQPQQPQQWQPQQQVQSQQPQQQLPPQQPWQPQQQYPAQTPYPYPDAQQQPQLQLRPPASAAAGSGAQDVPNPVAGVQATPPADSPPPPATA